MNQDHEPLEVIDTYGPADTRVGGRRWLRATAVVAMVGAGALGSWSLSQPSNSSAADSATESSGDAASTEAMGHGGGRHGRGPGLDAAATALGLSVDELRTELEGGATLAEVASAQGVEVDALIAAIVADATADIDAKVEAGELDAARAAGIKDGLLERVTAMVNGEFRGGNGPGGHGPGGHGPGGHGWGGFGHRGGMHLDTAAEVLGLTVDELRTQLQDGSTLADVAAAQDVDVDTLIDALVAEARERITARVNGEAPTDAAEEAAA